MVCDDIIKKAAQSNVKIIVSGNCFSLIPPLEIRKKGKAEILHATTLGPSFDKIKVDELEGWRELREFEVDT